MEMITIIEEIIRLLPIALALEFTGINIRALAKAKLQRKSFSGEIKYNPGSVLDRLRDFSNDELNYDKKKEILRPYVEKLSDYIPLEDMKLVRANFNSLIIKKRPSSWLQKNTGTYSNYYNKIIYSKVCALGHEFLHMASSTYDRETNIVFSGFEQIDDKNIIGTGLNEGYTELLNKRIYGVKSNDRVYTREVRVAKMLELFFEDGKEMTHLYFTCNLPGLIKHLESYAPRNEIIKLIIDLDDYNTYNNEYGDLFKFAKIISIYDRIYKWFISKSNNQEKIMKLEELINEDKIISKIVDERNNISDVNFKFNSQDNLKIETSKKR